MKREAREAPALTEVVEGDPLPVYGRELVPLVRVTSRAKRRASLYKDGLTGQGYGFVHMRPIAVLDRDERHPIHNQTARTIGWLILVAMLMPWLTALLVSLSRRLGGKPSPQSPA